MITQTTHPQNQAWKKHISFASQQCKAILQCTNSGCHDKPEIHSGSTPSLEPRFGTVRLLVVPKIEGDVKRSTFFIGCRSWGSCAQMDQHPTRNFLHGRNEQMDRKAEKMCSRKWWLCWKISVQCVREINFFHSDITVIILHRQKLILYNWRPHLSINHRSIATWLNTFAVLFIFLLNAWISRLVTEFLSISYTWGIFTIIVQWNLSNLTTDQSWNSG